MAVHSLADMTWEEVRDLRRDVAVAILPVGAIEAHGPHLPLSTDVIIAEAMAEAGAARLADHGWEILVLPALSYSAAPFAAGFPGTLSIGPETLTRTLVDIAQSLGSHGIAVLAIANAHLDPANIGAIRTAAEECGREALEAAEAESAVCRIVFPDVTRRPWAPRLTEEFRSGACHAGSYEGSVVLAAAPSLVREKIRSGLAPNPVSLSEAIREGKRSFEEAGGARAYFGYPAEASAAEGERTIAALGLILAEAVLAELEAAG